MIVGFEDDDAVYAQLLIRLKHEGLTKREFFRGVVRDLLSDNELFAPYLLDLKKRKGTYSKNKQKILDKEKKKMYSVNGQMGLSREEVEELFDMFEEEIGV